MLRLRLLGTMELTFDDRPTHLPDGRPARALLAWLALNPGVHSRDRVAEELWPGGPVKARRDSLKTALAKLRRALPEKAMERCFAISRADLGIHEGMVTTDVAEIDAYLDAGDLERALLLMRGEPLPGLDLNWVDDLRGAHLVRESGVLTSLAEDASRRGDRARAVELTRRRLRLDPVDEDASLQLIRHLIADGATRGALEEYARLSRAHRRAGLVHEPSVAMQRLMTGLRSRVDAGERSNVRAGAGDSADALHAFRWDAHLGSAPAEDPHPEFAVESIRIAYRASSLPDVLRVACLAGDSDDTLHTLTPERGYWFRWMVDPALDPADDSVFATDALLIDGHAVPCEAVDPLDVRGGRGVAHVYRLPDVDRLRLHSVDLVARSRVYLGDDRRVHADAVAGGPVTDAEFRLTVSEGIGASKVSVNTSRITALGDEGTPVCGPLFAPERGATGALARFSYPLQQGSGVTFEIVRETADLRASSSPIAA